MVAILWILVPNLRECHGREWNIKWIILTSHHTLALSHSFHPVVAFSISPQNTAFFASCKGELAANITNFWVRDVASSQSKQKENSHKLKLISCQHFTAAHTFTATSLFSLSHSVLYIFTRTSLRHVQQTIAAIKCSSQSNKSILFWACCGNNEYTSSSSYSRIKKNWSYFSCMKTTYTHTYSESYNECITLYKARGSARWAPLPKRFACSGHIITFPFLAYVQIFNAHISKQIRYNKSCVTVNAKYFGEPFITPPAFVHFMSPIRKIPDDFIKIKIWFQLLLPKLGKRWPSTSVLECSLPNSSQTNLCYVFDILIQYDTDTNVNVILLTRLSVMAKNFSNSK